MTWDILKKTMYEFLSKAHFYMNLFNMSTSCFHLDI